MKRILFLDDSQERIDSFTRDHSSSYVVCVKTASECIDNISKSRWDEIYLDHDLGGKILVDSSRKDTGMEVVRHIEEHGVIGNPKITVHSWNTVGGNIMFRTLRDLGYSVKYIPFGLKE